jgi:DNA (cytosine-5)-methyltransferase 1
MAEFKFIDLFAGIGGFHQAMRYLGGECIMAAEINQACLDTYKRNYQTKDIRTDVREIKPESIGKFDVLCAGFPCQPFSKAGTQEGFNDKSQGNLFYIIMDILDAHPEVKFVILENVRNLADKSENWDIIKNELMKRNFYITEEPVILSPHNFGIPQIRERVYILGICKDIRDKKILSNGFIHITDLKLEKNKNKDKCKINDAWSILEDDASDDYLISEEENLMIKAWDEFRIATKIKIIGFPVWINSFGLGKVYNEPFRKSIGYYEMPKWKQKFVDSNRKLYLENREYIDDWIKRYKMLKRIKLYQKFEWNCGTDVDDIKNTIIQIRQSGIRVKRPTFYPSLVAMVNTPIVWDKQKQKFRRITPREAANLQSFHGSFTFLGSDNQIYQQLGNSVNVRILKVLGKNLFSLAKKGWDKSGQED